MFLYLYIDMIFYVKINRKKKTTPFQLVFVILIAFAVVSFWRGVWGLSDYFIFPDNHYLSFLASFLIGLGVLILTGYITKEVL